MPTILRLQISASDIYVVDLITLRLSVCNPSELISYQLHVQFWLTINEREIVLK